MLVKICGLRLAEHALAAATAGADMLGLVFAPSRRQLSVLEGAAIAAALGAHVGARPELVGLFVNEQPARINAIVTAVGLDRVQLSGDETIAEAVGIGRPLIKALRLDGSAREAEWLAFAETEPNCLLLVDAHVPGAYGGTGTQANWARAAELGRALPLLLAGGLHAGNVAAAIAQVRPIGVDVSSGVESAGAKDAAKIAAFIGAARGSR